MRNSDGLPGEGRPGGPKFFGRYELLHRFASGGMGNVFLGRLRGDNGFERLVALKVIHEHLAEQTEFVQMFVDEARIASQLSHPNIAMTLELGRVGRAPFIAMEYVEGESLSAVLRRVRPPLAYCARIIADAAAGLHAAHELRGPDGSLLQVVHRDVSPHNILISYDGTVKLVDFGVARARGGLHSSRGQVKGKFCYMAPEQLEAAQSVDRRADIFALGIVLYEMTAWRRLFKADTEAGQISKVLACDIAPPSLLVPGYPARLEQVVLRALRRKPSERFSTAQEMQQELERYIAASGEPVLSSAIGKMMQDFFGSRIQEKRALIRQGGAANAQLAVEVPSKSESLVLGSVVAKVNVPPRRRSAPLIGGAAAVVVLALATVLVLQIRSRKGARSVATAAAVAERAAPPPSPSSQPSSAPLTQTPPSARGPEAAREIVISIRAEPASAVIRFAGKLVSNPFELRRPPGAELAEVDVEAPNHWGQRLQVPLATGGAWVIALQAQDRPSSVSRPAPKRPLTGVKTGAKPRAQLEPRPPSAAQAKTRVKPKTKTKAQDLGDEDVLANPYH